MTKYICDYDMVSIYSKLAKNIGEDMKNNINKFEEEVNSNISSWNGEAKSNFINSNKNFNETAKKNLENIIELANFLEDSARKIEELDSELASIEI